jgi:hypothetical protein
VLLAYAGRPEAEPTLREALGKLGGSPRLSFICHVVIGWLALDRGDVEEAWAHADAARATPVARELRPAGIALGARVLGARGRVDDAALLAEEAAREEMATKDLELTWGIAGVTLADARAAKDEAGARAALEPVVRRLTAVAATLPSAERARFWQRPWPNAEAHRLAVRLGVGS